MGHGSNLSPSVVIKVVADTEENPLLIIDGAYQEDVDIKDINPDDIATIVVYKDEKAIEKYGDRGKNGVIEVTMKTTALTTKYKIGKKIVDASIYAMIDQDHICLLYTSPSPRDS